VVCTLLEDLCGVKLRSSARVEPSAAERLE